MLDYIDTAHMTQGSLTSFVSDRFGNPNSALALNGGWTHVPSGIYFETREFTISVWIYPQQIGPYSRLIDFGNGFQSDNVIIKLDSGTNNIPEFWICPTSVCSFVTSSQPLVSSQWQHLATTFDGATVKIYINGLMTKRMVSSYIMPSVNRANNYFGKSNNPGGTFSWSYLDDLRFYNKCLNQSEIIDLMNTNSGKKIMFFLVFNSSLI